MTDRVLICPLSPGEGELLVTATLGTMNWCGERFARRDLLAAPHLAHYTVLLPARGDLALVAEDREGRAVGLAWALCLPEDDRGYGWVGPSTPEASFWVTESARGQGIGRRLVRALLDACRGAGFADVSLSVEEGNDRALALYRSEGFVAVPGREADGVMLRRIGPAQG